MRHFYVNDTEMTEEEFDDILKEAINDFWDGSYTDDGIDNTWGRIEIAGEWFWSSVILYEMNNDLYRRIEEEDIRDAFENQKQDLDGGDEVRHGTKLFHIENDEEDIEDEDQEVSGTLADNWFDEED